MQVGSLRNLSHELDSREVYAFVLGLVLGWICEKGGSIYFSMFFHILFNFWGTIIGPLLNNLKERIFWELSSFSLQLFLSILGIFLIPPGNEMARSESGAPYGCP